jgi:hypothetical protein
LVADFYTSATTGIDCCIVWLPELNLICYNTALFETAINKMTPAESLAKADSDFQALTAVDVVGLQSETHGRLCNNHLCCGHHVGVNDKLVCLWQVQQIYERPNAQLEEVIQVHKIGRDGLVTCHVGYLPKQLFCTHGSHRFDRMFLKVKHDLRCSNNAHERQRSHRNHGLVLCHIIKDDVKNTIHTILSKAICVMFLFKRKRS